MADKTPVRVVFNASNVATGMAEFQSGETVPIANGGTGISSIGSAGQILKVNAAGNALEFGAEGDLSITNLVAPTNADLTFSTSGTGNIILDAITVNGTTLSAADSATITVAEALDVTGQLTFSGLALPTSDGTSGQVLQTDGSGSLSFASVSLGDLSIVGSSIASPSNADLTLDPAGSGSIKLNANTDITGNLTVSGTLDLNDSNFTNVGSLQLDSIAGDGDTNTSITFSGSDVITIATGGSGRLTIGDGALSPVTTNQIDLGTSSLEFKDAFFDGTVTTDALTVSATSTLADTNITGAATLTNTSTDDSLLITTTEDSNSAAPVVTLKRNSSSPANADYLGRIKFKGENDADQEVQYASISGKIIDVADGSEDGAVEFNVKKAGSNNIAARLNSTELKLLNGTTLDVDGAGTFAGSVTATSITTNDIASNGSNADINLSPAGTGKVVVGTDVTVADDVSLISDGAILNFGANSEISVTHVHDTGLLLTDSGGTPTLQLHDANESVSSDGSNLILTSGGTAFTLPTSDGSAGEFLKTDGSGTLSFGTAAATASDDSRAVVKNNKSMGTSARTMDYFQATSADMAWYFTALNDLENDHVAASCFTVVHNDTDAFVSGPRGGASGTANTLPTTTADISSGQVRVRITAPSTDSKISFYKIPISRDNTSDATSGATVTTSNTDVDSASESIDTFAHASFRAAKYTILIEQASIAESGVTEALVVHNGSDAFVAQYGTVNTGNNDMITLSAAIDGSNVVLSAAGLTPNLSLKIHKTLLSDSMTAVSNGNQKIIGATTVSSSATAFDNFDLDDHNGAIYYVVGKNATESAFSVQEVFVTGAPGEAGVSQGAFVSTKATTQLEFTADFKSDADNSVELSIASTSGGSTIVNAYCIKCLAE